MVGYTRASAVAIGPLMDQFGSMHIVRMSVYSLSMKNQVAMERTCHPPSY